MSTTETNQIDEQLNAYNYCICFLDLLGQRDALRGEGLLPQFKSPEDRKQFLQKIKTTIGPILSLHQQAEAMLSKTLSTKESPFRKTIPPDLHHIWDDMREAHVQTQRWSDGLVSFTCLGDNKIKCHMNGLFWLFGLAGSMCLLGLASGYPLRGGIDVAWAVELRPGEIYGAAVARAYELESEVASYPRIVVGSRIVELLETHQANPGMDPFAQNDKALASLCLSMLNQDADGSWFVDYLGAGFQAAIIKDQHREYYLKARSFVEQQLLEHQRKGNNKLAFRYAHLLGYFAVHQHLGLDGKNEAVA